LAHPVGLYWVTRYAAQAAGGDGGVTGGTENSEMVYCNCVIVEYYSSEQYLEKVF